MASKDPLSLEHLSSEEIAAYLDGWLPAEEKARMQEHLADCDECRAEVTELGTLLRARSRRRSWGIAAPVALAAGLAALVLGDPFGMRDGDGPEGGLRPGYTSDREAVLEVSVLSPAGGATVNAESVEFAWEGLEPDAVYHLTVTDEGGDPLWTQETSRTDVVLPAGIRLESGEEYFWYVDALLPDGRTATTGVKSFTVVR